MVDNKRKAVARFFLHWRVICVLALFPCLTSAQLSAQATPYRVFIVQSYSAKYIWAREVRDGIEEAFAGANVEYESFSLNARQEPDAESLRIAAMKAFEAIQRFNPQVIIAADDAAQEYLVTPYLKGKSDFQVVFCGVNAPPWRYGYPADNVTGVRERWHFREAIALLKIIMPGIPSIAFLTDSSDTSFHLLESLHEDLSAHGPFAIPISRIDQVSTVGGWLEKIKEYQSTESSLAYGLYNGLADDITGETVPSDKIMRETDAIDNLPSLGFFENIKKYGVLCGVLESGQEQGYLAGKMARRILEQGLVAGTVPMEINVKGTVFLNLRAAERLGLRIPYEIIEAAGVVIQ